MIFLTGDIHIDHSITKLGTSNFPEQEHLTKDDYVIILGDFGLTWDSSDKIKHWLEWLTDKNFTTLFIDGNHENFDKLYEYPVVDYLGGRARKLNDSIYHLMRGEIYLIDGKTFFTFGGGVSIDKHLRIEGRSWWHQEIPSCEQIEHGFTSLLQQDFKVDYVLTHSAPTDVTLKIKSHHCEKDEVTEILDEFQKIITFDSWFFGHHHTDQLIKDNYYCLYNTIMKL